MAYLYYKGDATLNKTQIEPLCSMAHTLSAPSLGWVRAFVNRFNLRVEVLSRILQCEARSIKPGSAQPKVRASSPAILQGHGLGIGFY
jgi:hypothetical protein